MKRIMKQKINNLRSEPEARRLRVATFFTWGGAALLIVMWVSLLLPFQLRFNNDEVEPRVQGTIAPSESPTPSVPIFL